eukprot:1012203_1
MLSLWNLYPTAIHVMLLAGLPSLIHSIRYGEWKGTHETTNETPWLYADEWETSFITNFCIKADDVGIHHLKLGFSDGSLGDSDDSVPSGGEIGGGLESSTWQCFKVQNNECFVTINLRIGSWLDAMQVVTSKGRQSEFWGTQGGNAWLISAAYAGECISKLKLKIDTNTNPQSFRQIRGSFNVITWSPTSVPSETPSRHPTTNPTYPTMPPSSIPTEIPSIIPTEMPSIIHTITPTHVPTVVPIVATLLVSVRSYDSTLSAREESQGTVENRIRMPMYFVYILSSVCLCLCIVLGSICVRKTRNIKKKPVFVIDKPASASVSQRSVGQSKPKDQPQKAPALEESEDESVFVDEEERKEIKEWMSQSVKLPKYYDTLISNGFDKWDFLLDISTKEELSEIGISLVGHQVHILSEIAKCKASVKSGEGGIPDKKEISFIVEDSSSDSASAIGGNTTRGTDGDPGNASMDNNGVMAQGDQDVGSRKDSDLLDGELFVDPELIETIC